MVYATLRKFVYHFGNSVRETGQAIDRLGSRIQGEYAYKERCTYLVVVFGALQTRGIIHFPLLHQQSCPHLKIIFSFCGNNESAY